MHQIQEFGHAEPLVRVEGYEAPRTPAKNSSRKRATRKKEEVTDTTRKRRTKKEANT
jgi:hypothetical protein